MVKAYDDELDDDDEYEEEEAAPPVPVAPVAITDKLLDLPISELGLSVRTVNALESQLEVFTIRQLLMQPSSVILALPNVGKKTMTEIKEALRRKGIVAGSQQTQAHAPIVVPILTDKDRFRRKPFPPPGS